MTSTPLVSIIFPVYNGERFLRTSLESLLNQTYNNFELIIIDDGSTDGSVAIIKSYSDSRIKFIQNEKNLSLPVTLNEGIDIAQGEFIARMDCDDIAKLDRFEKQVEFLQAHPEIDILGTWAEVINEDGSHHSWNQPPVTPIAIKWRALSASPLLHPSIMVRSKVLKDNRYNEVYRNSQDFELWSRLLFSGQAKAANLPEALVQQRISTNSITQTRSSEGRLRSVTIPITNLQRYLKLTQTEIELLVKKGLYQKLSIKELLHIRSLYHTAATAFKKVEHPSQSDQNYMQTQLRSTDSFLFKYWLNHLI